jgi:phage head maturation protease
MERKSFLCPFEVKSLDGDANSAIGSFAGYASVWDSVDLGGDMVRKGAFRRCFTTTT